MSGSVATVSTPIASYRNPQRPPTSTALWAHLLRKDTLAPSSNSSGLSNPPIAPLDKTGTSMRILLHDTQSNFEKFSARVDKLYAGVAEAKEEIMMVKTLFQGEHEILNGEMVDLGELFIYYSMLCHRDGSIRLSPSSYIYTHISTHLDASSPLATLTW